MYKNIILSDIVAIGFLIVCFVFYAFFYQYHLFFAEQMQLFMLTSEHFYSYFSKPAAIACFLGDFFTQFYYLKYGGAIVITIVLSILLISLKKLIKYYSVAKIWSLLPLILVILVSYLHVSIAYSLNSTISFIMVIGFGIVYVSVRNVLIRFILGFFFIPFLYVVAGAFFYVFILSALVFEIKNNLKSIAVYIYILALIVFSVSFPLLVRSNYLLTKQQAYIYPISEHLNPKPDFFLEKLLALDSEWYFNRPDKVLEIANRIQLRNPISSYYYNLASAKIQILPERLLEYYQPGVNGLYIPIESGQSYIGITMSNEIYYFIGDVNEAQHAAILATIFSPKSQSSRLTRRLLEINIINGEYDVAIKYILMLEKTLFHRKWASGMRKYVHNESECRKAKWIIEKRNQYPVNDLLKATYNDFLQTLQHLYHNHPENKAVSNYLLCFYLLNKEVDSFSHLFIELYKNKHLESFPVLYQEALLIYFARNPHDENRKLMQIMPEVYSRFIEYSGLYEKNKGNGGAFQKNFGNTYWFYYHYATFKSKDAKKEK